MPKSSEVFTVFYCWQDDTPNTHCRRLIRNALDDAVKQLDADDALPYKVVIDQDTLNETGLCDIPAVILAKIAAADAVIADLTFVAHTEVEEGDPKHCSNPNILFELGYAFRAIGPERLVCVMNEVHGPRTGQIFDLDHRRHPISFKSPCEGQTVSHVTESLSKQLADALGPIVAKGPRSLTGEGAVRHDSERAQIESFHNAKREPGANLATLSFFIHPAGYRERRWKEPESLERLMSDRAVMSASHQFPPQPTGTATMPWGIYNDTYGESWGFTYAGQFWFQDTESCSYDGPKLSQRIISASPDPPDEPILKAGEWVNYIHALRNLYDLFQFAVSLSQEFNDSEQLIFSAWGEGYSGKWLGFHRNIVLEDPMGPSVSPGFRRNFELSASAFRDEWEDRCIDCMKEFCDMFSRDGRRISRDALANWIDKFSGRK